VLFFISAYCSLIVNPCSASLFVWTLIFPFMISNCLLLFINSFNQGFNMAVYTWLDAWNNGGSHPCIYCSIIISFCMFIRLLYLIFDLLQQCGVPSLICSNNVLFLFDLLQQCGVPSFVFNVICLTKCGTWFH
jgi:hypothetical protein